MIAKKKYKNDFATPYAIPQKNKNLVIFSACAGGVLTCGVSHICVSVAVVARRGDSSLLLHHGHTAGLVAGALLC